MAQEKATLGTYLQELPRCIRFLDGALFEDTKPWRDMLTKSCFNGWKKIYVMNIINFDPHKPIHLHR